MSIFAELQAENEKSGMFTEVDMGFSYPMGFPVLDQQLGFMQNIKLPNGDIYSQKRLGVPAGSMTMFIGPSSSGKTAASIQAAWNIVQDFGEDAGIYHIDAEGSTEPQRILDLTGMSEYEYAQRYRLISDPKACTIESILDAMVKLGQKKESDKKRYMYNTGFKSVITGEDIIHYIPSALILDSQMKIVSENIDQSEIQGLTSNGRDVILRNFFFRNLLSLTRKYNINVFDINHLGNQIELQPGKGGAKQLTFIPTGKNVPGGEKCVYYTSSMICWQPINSKDGIKTEETNGYNGVPVKAAVCKSRSGPGGKTATLEFIQEAGFDRRLTLINFAKEHGLIQGRNPSSYFAVNPEVKFDTRNFIEEMTKNPELIRTLYRECKPHLDALIRPAADPDDPLRGANMRKIERELMKELY